MNLECLKTLSKLIWFDLVVSYLLLSYCFELDNFHFWKRNDLWACSCTFEWIVFQKKEWVATEVPQSKHNPWSWKNMVGKHTRWKKSIRMSFGFRLAIQFFRSCDFPCFMVCPIEPCSCLAALEGTCSYSTGPWYHIFWQLFSWNISNKPCARISPGAAKLVQVNTWSIILITINIIITIQASEWNSSNGKIRSGMS